MPKSDNLKQILEASVAELQCETPLYHSQLALEVDWPSLPVSCAKCHALGWPKSLFWFFRELFLTNPTLGNRTG